MAEGNPGQPVPGRGLLSTRDWTGCLSRGQGQGRWESCTWLTFGCGWCSTTPTTCAHVCACTYAHKHMDAYTYAYTKHRGTITGTHTCMHILVYTHTRMRTYSSSEPIHGPYARTCSPSPCALTSRLSWAPHRRPRLLPFPLLLSPLWQAPSRAARLLLEVRVRLCSAACWGCTSRKSATQRGGLSDCRDAESRWVGCCSD